MALSSLDYPTSPDTPVEIFTDGACSGNPGPGGWGAILRCSGVECELSGSVEATTNNRMELVAVIEALRILTCSCRVDLYTDSQYVQKGICNWIEGWKKRGWKTVNWQPVENQDLWQSLEAAAAQHDVTWHWIRGHAGHPVNERADILARAELKQARRRTSRNEQK